MAVCDCVQLAVLRKGLDLHGKRIAPALKGMQTNLEEKLELMVFEVFPERRKKVSHELLGHGCPHPSLLPPSLPPLCPACSFPHSKECSVASNTTTRDCVRPCSRALLVSS